MKKTVLLLHYQWWYVFRYRLRHIRILLWNGGLKLWWYRLWIRKNEFHKSLDMDCEAFSEMNCQQRVKYSTDLARRRSISCKKSL